MSSSKQLLPGLFLAGFLAACGPATVEPELTLTASPRTIDGVAQKSTVKMSAVDDKGKLGTGKVRVTSGAGSLKDGVEVDLLAGEGTTDFTCARATDVTCTGYGQADRRVDREREARQRDDLHAPSGPRW